MPTRRPLCLLLTAVLAAPVVPAAAQASAPAAAPGCAPPGTLACLQITSPLRPGLFLDIDNPGDPHSYLKLTPAGGDSAFWKLEADADSMVRVRNLASANCADVWSDGFLDQWECRGQTNQRWHLVPYSLDAGTYRIRQTDTGNCVTVDGDWAKLTPCGNADTAQEWRLGVGGKSPSGVRALAVKYAMRQCGTKPDSCSWKENTAKKSPAFLGAGECVSQLVHNKTGKAVTYTRTWSQTVGWQNTLGGSITVGVEAGVDFGVVSKITASVQANYSHAWIGSEVATDALAMTLDPGQYGWVTRRPLLKKVTGTWTLDLNGQPWQFGAVLRLPAKDGTDKQSSVLEIRTAAKPPANCG
ncbi:ricin-type beta-trefoil lectin domain protein [Actinokineospora guangxiensis]|uniref:Ricin-type beta-trefoil lectin domain protein n=1 Tax=Actinokineospora guangxiensis TaxID=1490288 RepID=A0ABW0EUJ7_9PSEU